MNNKTIFLILCFFAVGILAFAENRLSIIHTNDLHSHILGFSPNGDYSPESVNDDETIGGWARISTVMKEIRASKNNPVVTVDAGDYSMGSLFHTITREAAIELMLMDAMGFDATTFGNHEFDFGPEALGQSLGSAFKHGRYPVIVASNTQCSEESPADDELEKYFINGMVKEYYVQEKGGIKIGYFGLTGVDAIKVSPFLKPLTFSDQIETSKKMVSVLREEENVDVVICLSHGGLNEDPKLSEDQVLAKSVPGIDVIISAHTHDLLQQPIIEGDTIIVQVGEYGKYIGLIDLIIDDDKNISLENYELTKIDDSIPGDPEISNLIAESRNKIDEIFLAEHDLKSDTVIAETDFDLNLIGHECNLGNLIADSIKWSVENAEKDIPGSAPVALAVQCNGMIRDDMLTGKTGKITTADAFRAQPLGIEMKEQTIGYPILSFYITAGEIKKVLEMITTIVPMKSEDFALQISGARFTYNPNRILFDRVTDIKLQNSNGEFEDLDYSESNKKLYRVATNTFNAFYLKVIGDYTAGILDIKLKDRNGNQVVELSDHIVDGDLKTPGVQQIKEWVGMVAYMKSFPDTDGNGIANIPEIYRDIDGRQRIEASWNPVNLLKNGNDLTALACTAFFLALIILFLAVFIPVRIVRKRKAKRTVGTV